MTVASASRPSGDTRVSNATLGMVLLLMAEAMFFAGLVSAYLVARAHAVDGWPPPGQPRLPLASTAVNTVVLLLSLVTLHRARRDDAEAGRMLLATFGLGTLFLLLQGREWVALIGYGLTSRSSLYGAFFYTIVGAHGLHVMAGLAALLATWRLTVRDSERAAFTMACSLYWVFVVGLWPILYLAVYVL